MGTFGYFYDDRTPRQRWRAAHWLARLADHDPGHTFAPDDTYAERRMANAIRHINPTRDWAVAVASRLHPNLVTHLGRYRAPEFASTPRRLYASKLDRPMYEVVGNKRVPIANPFRRWELGQVRNMVRVARQTRQPLFPWGRHLGMHA